MRLQKATGERAAFSVSNYLGRVWRRLDADNVTGLSAQVSYYFALALFPFLILVGAIVGTLPFTHAWQSILTWITQSLPGDTRNVVFETVENLTQGRNGFLSVGLAGTIWAASGGLMNLAWALNVVYHVPETRSYWNRLALSVLVLFLLAMLLLLSFGLLSAGDRLDQWLAAGVPGSPVLLLFPVARWMVSVFLIVLSINVMDYLLPNLKRRWRWIRPGMGLMVTEWILASLGFNWYLRHIASYNKTYGVLGAFVVLMIWTYIAVLIALTSAEIDAELQVFRRAGALPNTTESVPDTFIPAS